MSKIFTIVRNIIAEHTGIPAGSLEPSTRLDALGLDGMDVSELVMGVEDEFEVEISDEEYNEIGTLDDIVELIKRKKKQ